MPFQTIDWDITSGPLVGVRERKPAVEAGVAASYGPVRLPVRTDVSGRHDGYEISLAPYLFTSMTYELLDDEISASPIVDQDTQFSAFAGIARKFGNIAE